MSYETFHPQTSINNGIAIILGLGLLVFPVIYSVYAGKEYKRHTIKPKSVYFSLQKVFLAKIIVTMLSLCGFLLIYSSISFVVSKICWTKYLEKLFAGSNIKYAPVHFSILENGRVILLAFAMLMFYSFFCMLISIAFKSSVAGVVATIAFNYVKLPTKYSAHYMFTNLINSNFFTSDVSLFEFKSSSFATLSNRTGILILSLYFLTGIILMLFLGKTQKN